MLPRGGHEPSEANTVVTGAEGPVARVSIGTVKGDLHDIGKNLVGAMLEGGGFEIIDLGVDVSVRGPAHPDRLFRPIVIADSVRS